MTIQLGAEILFFFLYIKAEHSVNTPSNDNDLVPIEMVVLILTFFEDDFPPKQYLFIYASSVPIFSTICTVVLAFVFQIFIFNAKYNFVPLVSNVFIYLYIQLHTLKNILGGY